MATMWRKTMLYLGLGPDEEYDDYDPGDNDQAAEQPRSAADSEVSAVGAVRPMGGARSHDQGADTPGAGDLGSGFGSSLGRTKVVRPMPVASTARPRVVVPTSFNQAQELADTFKGSQPVLINLRHAERDVARRVIDFSSGLCYGLGGRMEKIDSQVYLLSPANVEVSEDERARLRDRGYDD